MSGLKPGTECNICNCEFDIELEGGIQGYIGIIPFSLCPMCYSGLMDMYDKLHGEFDEYEDGQEIQGDDED